MIKFGLTLAAIGLLGAWFLSYHFLVMAAVGFYIAYEYA